MSELEPLKELEETEFLRRIHIFSDLSDDEFDKILGIIDRVGYKEDDVVIEEGTEGRAFYVVKNGYVKVQKKGDSGEDIFLTVLAPGEHFGEISLVDSNPRSATVIAQRDCELFMVTGEEFDNLMNEDKDLAVKIYKAFIRVLCSRLREADEVITFGDIEY